MLIPTCVVVMMMASLVSSHNYLGCFHDQGDSRALGDSFYLEDDMKPDVCEERCGKEGFTHFGLQYSRECWCGNQGWDRHGSAADNECQAKCGGNPAQMCGGDNRNSVYEVTKKFEVAVRDSNDRPLLALVMIVKDEAHTLPNTLIAIKPYLDWYYILDTGSTDGTPEAIRKTLGPKGNIYHEPFIDYGRSRNRILDLAQQADNKPVFVLMLSADETVYNADALRKFCEENRHSSGHQHEAYPVVMDVGWKFDSVRLSRTDNGWRYKGRVHEYLAAPDGQGRSTIRVPRTYIKFRVTDPERRGNREYKIAAILEQQKAEEPWDTRTAFYLARYIMAHESFAKHCDHSYFSCNGDCMNYRTYNVLKNHTFALAEFRRRIALGGWQEEVYESYFAIAWQLKAMDKDWSEVQQAFLDAHDHSPERAEPLFAIAQHYQALNKRGLAFLFALRCSQLAYPSRAVLWVQADVYSHQCHSIVATDALELQQYELGARAAFIASRALPGDHHMANLLEQYKSHISADTWARLSLDPNAASVVPSVPLNQNTETTRPAPPGLGSAAFRAGLWRVLGPVLLVVAFVLLVVGAVLGGCKLMSRRNDDKRV